MHCFDSRSEPVVLTFLSAQARCFLEARSRTSKRSLSFFSVHSMYENGGGWGTFSYIIFESWFLEAAHCYILRRSRALIFIQWYTWHWWAPSSPKCVSILISQACSCPMNVFGRAWIEKKWNCCEQYDCDAHNEADLHEQRKTGTQIYQKKYNWTTSVVCECVFGQTLNYIELQFLGQTWAGKQSAGPIIVGSVLWTKVWLNDSP